jgi:hypothetical protein
MGGNMRFAKRANDQIEFDRISADPEEARRVGTDYIRIE